MSSSPRTLYRWLAVACAVAMVTYFWIPPAWARGALLANTLLVPICTVAGVWRYRPTRPGLWLSLGATTMIWALGQAPGVGTARLRVSTLTVHDLTTALGYVIVITALTLSSRHITRGRSDEALLDIAIHAVAGASVFWGFTWGSPLTEEASVSASITPFFDVLTLIAAARLLVLARTLVAPLLLASSLLMTFVGDVSSLVLSHGAGYVWWMASGLLMIAASQHPSMVKLGEHTVQVTPYVERLQLDAMALASLMPPFMLLREADQATLLGAGPVLACAAGIFFLVMVRLERMRALVDGQRLQLEALARTDHLTSLPNRRTGEAELQRMQVEAIDQGVPLVLALLDLDHFKDYNDRHGHPAGDRLLEATAGAWRRALPPDVFVSRHGGEEFLVVARGRHPDNVRLLLEGLRGTAHDQQTFSAGVAVWDGLESLLALVDRADVALYEAKATGRDRVCFAVPEPVRPSSTRAWASAST